MKEIIVYSEKHGNKIAFVSDDKFESTNQLHWSLKRDKGNNTDYAHRTIFVNGKKTSQTMHRFVFGEYDTKKYKLDHEDFNGLNNTDDNLRLFTHRQNSQHRKSRVFGTSKHNGVSLHVTKIKRKDGTFKVWSKWRAQINIDGKLVRLGLFNTEDEAAVVRNEAQLKHYGNLGTLNKIEKEGDKPSPS